MNNTWKALFFELLDSVEQIPHPMAEEAWEYYDKFAGEEMGGAPDA